MDTLIKNTSITTLLNADGAIVVIIPFIGSLVALAFEAGYISFYDVPVSLIQLDFVKIIAATLVVVAYVFLFAILAAVIVSIVRSGNLICRALADSATAFLVFAPFLVLTSSSQTAWGALGILCLILVLGNFFPPLFQWRTGSTYKQRLKKYLDEEKEKLTQEKDSLVERYILQPIALIWFLLVIVFLIGQKQAESQTQYWVLKDDPDWVLLANYGDNLIFKEVNEKSNQIEMNLRLIRVNDSQPLNLQRVMRGKLKPLNQGKNGNT